MWPVPSVLLYLVGHGTKVEPQHHPLGLGLGDTWRGPLVSQERALGSEPGGKHRYVVT